MTRSLRTKKLLLATGTVSCVIAALAVASWALRPLEALPQRARPLGGREALTSTAAVEGTEPGLEEFAQLWKRPLRAPLYDPPPVKPPEKTLPPLRVELLGTIIEPGNSLAMVSADGTVEYKRIGETIGPRDSPAEIIEILSDSVVLQRSQERQTLRIKSEEIR